MIHRRRHIRAINTHMRRHAVCARVEKSTTIRRCVCGNTDTVPQYVHAWGRRVRVWVLKRCSTLWAYYNCDTSTIRLQHATTRYEVFRALAYEIDSSTPRESVIGVSCMLIDSSMHTAFTLYLYRPTLHRVCEYARNCLYKRN